MLARTLALLVPLVALAPQAKEEPLRSLLPLPKHAIAVRSDPAAAMTLAQLLEKLSAETGVTFSSDPSVKATLLARTVEVSAAVELAPEQAYPWVEGILLQNGFHLGVLTLEGKPLLGVYPQVRRTPDTGDPARHFVPEERIGECRMHPALLVQTVLDMGPNVDVRTLGNSLRALSGSNQDLAIMPVANTNSVALTGPGLVVANLADLLMRTRDQAKDVGDPRAK